MPGECVGDDRFYRHGGSLSDSGARHTRIRSVNIDESCQRYENFNSMEKSTSKNLSIIFSCKDNA